MRVDRRGCRIPRLEGRPAAGLAMRMALPMPATVGPSHRPAARAMSGPVLVRCRRPWCHVLAAASAAAPSAPAAGAAASSPPDDEAALRRRFADWVAAFRSTALAAGIREDTFDAAFDGVQVPALTQVLGIAYRTISAHILSTNTN